MANLEKIWKIQYTKTVVIKSSIWIGERFMAKGTTKVGFEEKLWQAADKLRSNMDAAEYKHVVLGLIFLKYVSDSFEELYDKLKAQGYGDEEDRDEYLAENVFWVPKESRWNEIKAHATSADIGKVIDNAMDAIENENTSLKGVLTKNYARPELDKTRLGELVTLFTNIEIGSKTAREKDVLGRVYEYFLGKFASAEGKLGGEFYTPSCIVRTLVEMIEPFEGQIFDPACGSGGMFCQSARFVKEHQGNIRDISIFGQESNPTTWKLAKMNLAIRGLEANLGKHNADSFHDDQHKTLKANYILANPPFNISDWGGERVKDDVRWAYGTPPAGNANFAWLQHMLYHLNPVGGVAGTVLANGSLSSNTSNEGEIRKNMINGDVVECIVSMPGQLFYSTGMRIGELVQLNIEDIDFDERECIVLGKGDKERIVYFDARTKLHLKEYLESRKDDNKALFVGLRAPHNRVTINGIELRIRQLGHAVGIKKCHPHKFRRTMATVAIDKGMPIEQVQKLLGHEKIDTTLHYVMVKQSNVKNAHRKYIG